MSTSDLLSERTSRSSKKPGNRIPACRHLLMKFQSFPMIDRMEMPSVRKVHLLVSLFACEALKGGGGQMAVEETHSKNLEWLKFTSSTYKVQTTAVRRFAIV